jgi:steroid 5-alpha reductase family enzyme
MDALIVCLWILAGICALTWVLSLITKEYSWVDRIWSIIPLAYVWVFAGFAGFTDVRLNVIAILVTLWGARLTFNFARKGGYAPGGEDYRWEIMRQRITGWKWHVFNFLFIVIFQNALLFLISLPSFTAYENRGTPFGVLDLIVTVAFVGLLVMETVADQQQWNFHQWKKKEVAAGRTPQPGFLTTGLFSTSRHPNFFAEQAQWWVLFFFGAIAADSVMQWTIVGPVLLTALFIGSYRLAEEISSSKYPAYVEYQKRVSPLIPWFPRREEEASTAKA